MSKTLVEKGTGNELLRKYLETHKLPIAKTAEDLYSHSVADDNGEEVDDFLQLLDEWRHNDLEYGREID